MKRALAIALEYGVYSAALPLLIWVAIVSFVSFVSWENLIHPDTGSFILLRSLMLLGFCVASWRTYHLIKDDKI